MKNATPPASRTILTATRLLAILGIGVGVLAGTTPTEAQNYTPTRFRVDAIRHLDRGDAEVDLRWLHPTSSNATSFTVHYTLRRGSHGSATCATTPANPTTNLNTTTATETTGRRITIRQLDRETSACFWIRADFVGGSTSNWRGVEDHPIDLRDETSPGTIPAPNRPTVQAGDARVTVDFGHSGSPTLCHAYSDDETEPPVLWAHAQWFYAKRLEGEPFGDNPAATRVPALSASGGGSYPVVQNIVNGNSYVFKTRLECGPVLVARVLSPWSEESAAVTPRGTAEELTEPQGLSVVPVRVPGRDTAALRLTWGHPSSGAPNRYRLQYYRAPAAEMDPPWTSVTLLGSSRSYEITGLSFNAEYQIRLRAEAENARPDCKVASGRVRPCGPWATVSRNYRKRERRADCYEQPGANHSGGRNQSRHRPGALLLRSGRRHADLRGVLPEHPNRHRHRLRLDRDHHRSQHRYDRRVGLRDRPRRSLRPNQYRDHRSGRASWRIHPPRSRHSSALTDRQ